MGRKGPTPFWARAPWGILEGRGAPSLTGVASQSQPLAGILIRRSTDIYRKEFARDMRGFLNRLRPLRRETSPDLGSRRFLQHLLSRLQSKESAFATGIGHFSGDGHQPALESIGLISGNFTLQHGWNLLEKIGDRDFQLFRRFAGDVERRLETFALFGHFLDICDDGCHHGIDRAISRFDDGLRGREAFLKDPNGPVRRSERVIQSPESNGADLRRAQSSGEKLSEIFALVILLNDAAGRPINQWTRFNPFGETMLFRASKVPSRFGQI